MLFVLQPDVYIIVDVLKVELEFQINICSKLLRFVLAKPLTRAMLCSGSQFICYIYF